jgi:ubiquinone/menaquinone biosynthesis C-methylase UbiE
MSAYDKDGAIRYDQIIDQPVYKYYVNKKLNLINDWLKPKSVLLDAGCGTGVYTTFLAKRCETIVGLDVSREMIMRGLFKVRHQGLDNVYFVIGDIANAPVQDRVFDLVFSVNTFHHFSDKNTILKGLAEKARCCKRNCRMLIFELNPSSLGWSKNAIPKIIRGFIYLLLFPLRQRVMDNVEKGTQMINVPELLRETGRIKLVSLKVGGFIPTYCPKFALKIFVLLERTMEVTPLLRRYGAHVLVVGEVQ